MLRFALIYLVSLLNPLSNLKPKQAIEPRALCVYVKVDRQKHLEQLRIIEAKKRAFKRFAEIEERYRKLIVVQEEAVEKLRDVTERLKAKQTAPGKTKQSEELEKKHRLNQAKSFKDLENLLQQSMRLQLELYQRELNQLNQELCVLK